MGEEPLIRVAERVILFNLATGLTVALGVVTLYLALFVIAAVCGVALITPNVLESQLRHKVHLGYYLQLAWLVSSLATIGSASGAAVENDVVVREAAYGYRPDERTENDRAEA